MHRSGDPVLEEWFASSARPGVACRSSLMVDSASDSTATSKRKGSFHRDASDRLTFHIYESESERYVQLCSELAAALDLKPVSDLVVGHDEMFRGDTNGHLTIGMEWDIGSGFTIVAKDVELKQPVRQIAIYVVPDATP